ncbi:hypothetical protein K3759_13925 [Sulfitobacter sp. W027]|uniref:Cap15 family cyclic dinucleotide receptor domain-containing protein n=1 Tax=Sulfitobacter sp. W027 TaxID=2867025 RepID=UPI0021A7F011|nr:hypothetical protein [Sulfitobacter sp. W027]UWR33031.1 hypothetical protein K3759_13925 [Sulfitobacter sp. W027]
MAWHEYSVVGHSRAKIGMYISFVSGAIAGGVATAVGLVLTSLQRSGFSIPEIVLWPITGGVIFGLLFVIFDKFIWKSARLKSIVGVPDISGDWSVRALSFNPSTGDKTPWTGKLVITQCYEKITVHLSASESQSKSVSAAIVDEGSAGYRLIYSYKNQPRPGDTDMQSHLGHCDILFERTLGAAEGQYFTGLGRYRHGTMTITRKATDVRN